ncbi:methyltransferase domain-containing protein [Paenibacillus vandeheii]
MNELSTNLSFKMLDVGSVNDLLSVFFNIRGWDSYSIEPNHEAVGCLKKFNVNVFPQFLDDELAFPVSGLGFITIRFGLEHLRNPRLILSKAYDALTRGGVIRIVVPNDFSKVQMSCKQRYDEKYRWIQYPDHTNCFDFESLKQFISNHGFKEIYRTASFLVDLLLLSGLNYNANLDEQQKVGSIISNFEILL